MNSSIPCIIGASLLLASAPTANASDLEKLAKRGYGALIETQVSGEFKGCEAGRRIPLSNGMIFVCGGYSYSYAYSPDVFILSNVRARGDIKVVIDDEEYDGTVYNPNKVSMP